MIFKTIGRRHMCLSVNGCLKRLPNNNRPSFAADDNGKTFTNRQLRAELQKAASEGKKMLPLGDCDNFDFETGCRGHDITLLVHDWEFEEGNG